MQHWGECVLGLILGRPAVKNTLLHRISLGKGGGFFGWKFFRLPESEHKAVT